MNFILLCISFAILIKKFPGASAQTQKEVGADGPKENVKEIEGGAKKIKDSGMDEEKFGKVLKWIQGSKVCISTEEGTDKKTYALLEEPMDDSSWFNKPYTTYSDRTNSWYERLYNTLVSMASKLLREEHKKVTVKISIWKGCTMGKDASSLSRYGIGARATFVNAEAKGERASKAFEISIESPDDHRIQKAVDELLATIRDTYDKNA